MDIPQKIVLFGGTGKVGRHIARLAVEKGYDVRMLVRDPQKVTLENVEVVKGDIRDVNIIRKILRDCHVVINAFGQPNKAEPIYSKVTENILHVMTEYKINRYIGVTGGSLTIDSDKKNFINRLGAVLFKLLYSEFLKDRKKEWRILLENKHIDWTLVRLPFVQEGEGKDYVKENLFDMPGTKISNQDISSFIVDQINRPIYVHQAPFISN
ncbi:NAD(P)-dependent oxidoreductase [Ornithinibacillus scapharcae]|uniref:NAD(P)-dependent oxidoreductase n=1 Tax=Ornithinibacillus scapharcae TaxID=1147159 RepID=UPI000225B81F|nr:NAD(P)H-binding protein [Ornithinibacillus scapharcae]